MSVRLESLTDLEGALGLSGVVQSLSVCLIWGCHCALMLVLKFNNYNKVCLFSISFSATTSPQAV